MNTESIWQPNPETWRRSYEADGYLVVENALDTELLAEMKAELERIEQAMKDESLTPNLRRHITRECDRENLYIERVESTAICNIMELPLFAPVFRDLIAYPRVLDILEALFESSEFSFHNYKCIAKMPGGEMAFRWHRDLPYLQHSTPNLITCMLCLDAMTKENGATIVCPGSHRIAHEDVLKDDVDIHPDRVPTEQAIVECPAGSAVLFHVNLIHGGGANQSQAKRRNVIGIWAGPDTYPTTPARYAYQDVMPRSSDLARRRQIEMTFQKTP